MDKRVGISKELAGVAMGRIAADLIIKNGTLVNVLTGILEENIDVAVYKGVIAFVGDSAKILTDEKTEIVCAEGKYISPGFIDSHMHVESSMVDLRSLAAGVLVHGTTTICPDIHEMTNVFGLKAVELFHETTKDIPLKVMTAMPVCVPSIQGMENAGAEIGPDDVETAYKNNWAQLQGEQMNFPGVLFGDDKVHQITDKALEADLVMTGHYASPDLGQGLNSFIASGFTACHESTCAEEAYAKASRGMNVQMRYGSAWLDLPKLVPAFLDRPEIDTRMFTIVTDDMSAATILQEGHLVRALRKAVECGVTPMTAIQMATINAAQLLEKQRSIGSIAPGKIADILLLDDLNTLTVHSVFCDGKLIAEKGQLKAEIPPFNYPEWAVNSVHIDQLKATDFKIKAPTDAAKHSVRAIRIYPGEVLTKEEIVSVSNNNGYVEAEPKEDIAKVAMYYRHKDDIAETDRKAFTFIRGTNFGPDCAYASTVSHDCHNLLIIGTNDEDMAIAANSLKQCGGGIVVVKNQQIVARIELPFAGLMSIKSIEEAAKELTGIQEAIHQLGCQHSSVEMTISLLGLIVLPELHISNKGLVELKGGNPPRFVELFV